MDPNLINCKNNVHCINYTNSFHNKNSTTNLNHNLFNKSQTYRNNKSNIDNTNNQLNNADYHNFTILHWNCNSITNKMREFKMLIDKISRQ